MTDEILFLAFFLSGSLHPDHVTQQQRAFMCAAEVWAENEEWLPSAQVPPAENANTHTGFSLPQSACIFSSCSGEQNAAHTRWAATTNLLKPYKWMNESS